MDRHAVISTESQRFAEVLAGADAQSRCPTCPDWSAADLLWHLTEVHFFWAAILGSGALTDADAGPIEDDGPQRPDTVAETLRMREQATARLISELERLDDETPRWTWWQADQTAGFTRRMQTYEATMHRVDAELTAGLEIGPIDPEVAAGAVDHCADVMWGWLPDEATYEKQAVVELVAADTGQRWPLEVGHWTHTGADGETQDEPRAVRATEGVPTATVTAPVVDLALWAWTRGGSVRIEGEAPARAAVDALLTAGIP